METENELTIDWGKLAVIFLCGRMGCGKSTAIEAIVRNSAENGVHDWVVAFTPTMYTGEFSFIPKEACFEFGDGSKLLKMYSQIQAYKKRCALKNKTAKLKRGLCIISDCMGNNSKLMNRLEFVNYFITSRHFGPIDLLIDGQRHTAVVPAVRQLATHVFIWKTSSPAQIKSLYQFAGGHCENQKEFRSILKAATKKPYYCLLYRKDAVEPYMSFCFEIPKPFKLSYKLPFRV